MSEEEEFEKHIVEQEFNWARLIFIMKKHFDIWAHKTIKPASGPLKLSYFPVIANINLAGNTNVELSKKSRIAKQAMSRTIKELEEKGMISSKPLKSDKRSTTINLTDHGKAFMLDANRKVEELTKIYVGLVGEKDFETTVHVLAKIIKYHESLQVEDEDEE